METKTNLFKIYTNDSKTLDSYSNICDKLDNVNKLLDENICESAVSEEQIEINAFNLRFLENLSSQMTFNIVDLMPLETLRRCGDSLAYDLVSDNVTPLNLTVENQLSNLTDDIFTGINEKYEMPSINYDTIATDNITDTQEQMLTSLYDIIAACIKPKNNINAKYFYNIAYEYSLMYMLVYGKLHDNNFDETIDPKFNSIKNYIQTYLILLELLPQITVYASSSNIRKHVANKELENIFAKIDILFTESFNPNDSYDSIDNVAQMFQSITHPISTNIRAQGIIQPSTPQINNTVEASYVPSPSVSNITSVVAGPASSPEASVNESQPNNLLISPPRSVVAQVVPGSAATTQEDATQTFLPIQIRPLNFSDESEGEEQGRTGITKKFGQGASFFPKGGSCKHIDLRNELLFVKFLFEWSHDFGVNRALSYVNSDYTIESKQLTFIPNFYTENGIFQQITKGWESVIDKRKQNIQNDYANADIEVDKNIFDRLTEQNIKHEESTYVYNIIDALITYCSNIKDDLFYIPIVELTCKPKEEKYMKEFFTNVIKYYNSQRMFIKPDDTKTNVHLSITSDNNNDIPEHVSFGYNMQDMNLDPMSIALVSKRYELYKSWNDNLSNSDNAETLMKNIFGTFQTETGTIINNAKQNEIRTVAKMLDPLPSGKFEVEIIDNVTMIKQDFIEEWSNEEKIMLDQSLKVSTIYGINQLLNVWINNTTVVNNFEYILDKAGTVIDAISFKGINNETLFDWYYGDCTVNVVCGALINVGFNMSKNPKAFKFDTVLTNKNIDIITNVKNEFTNSVKHKYPKCEDQWMHIYTIAKFIMFHENFREQSQYFNKTIQTFLMIIAYLKSCGDEYQRLMCESINYLINGKNEYFNANLPDNYTLDILSKIGTDLKNKISNVFFLTKDRILIGESIEKNTPLFTNLKTPHDAFYDDETVANDFYKLADDIKGNYLSKKGIGLMSNRRYILNSSSGSTLNYGTEILKNSEKIRNLLNAIVLKTFPENYNDTNIDEMLKNVTDYYVDLKTQIVNVNQEPLLQVQDSQETYIPDVDSQETYISAKTPEYVSSVEENYLSPNSPLSVSSNNSNNSNNSNRSSILVDNRRLNLSSESENEGSDSEFNMKGGISEYSQDETIFEGSQNTQSEESEEAKYNIQLDIISNLSKLLLALEYYNKETIVKMKPFYDKCISCEISKAVSVTINSDMLNNITLKNSCKIPGTIDALDKIVKAMYDEPEVIDKLIESYEEANNMLSKKLLLYKDIVNKFNFGIEMVPKNKNINWQANDLQKNYLDKIFNEDIKNDVVNKYTEYISYIELKKEEYGTKILEKLQQDMNLELRKMEKSRSNITRKSYAESSDEEIKEKIMEDLNSFFAEKEELNRRKQEALQKQQKAKEALEAEKKAKGKDKKTFWQKLKTFLSPVEAKKQISTTSKDIKTIDKSLSNVTSSIQKLTEKKQKIEIKDCQKTKVFGYETFKNALDYLLGRRATGSEKRGLESDDIMPLTQDNLNQLQSPTKRSRITPLRGGKTQKKPRKHYFTKSNNNKLTNQKKRTKNVKRMYKRKHHSTKRV
jgi:hypothetical protein